MTDSTRNVVNKQPVVLDPNFFLPPGVVDVRHVNDTETDGLYSDESDDTIAEGDVESPVDSVVDGNNDVLQPPGEITIVSQTVKVADDGKFAVDVVIDVEEIPGVTNYETRLTKV
jgi:hypothetical protein